jgi:hypothetical protein
LASDPAAKARTENRKVPVSFIVGERWWNVCDRSKRKEKDVEEKERKVDRWLVVVMMLVLPLIMLSDVTENYAMTRLDTSPMWHSFTGIFHSTMVPEVSSVLDWALWSYDECTDTDPMVTSER